MDCVGEGWAWRAAVDCVGKGGFGARLWFVGAGFVWRAAVDCVGKGWACCEAVD